MGHHIWNLSLLAVLFSDAVPAKDLTMIFGPPETIDIQHFGPPHPSRPFGGKMSNTLDLYPDGVASGQSFRPVSSSNGGKTWQNVSMSQPGWVNYTKRAVPFFSQNIYFSNSTHRWAQDLGDGNYLSQTADQTSFSINETSIFRFEGGMLISQLGPRVTFTGLPRPACRHTPWGTHASGHVVLADGTHVQSAIVMWCGAPFTDGGRGSVIVFRSRDGYNYEYISNISTSLDLPHSLEGPNEHDLALLSNGDILCVMRLGAGDPGDVGPYLPFYKSLSKDGGRTWSTIEAMPGIGCARPHLLQLGNVTLLSGGRRMLHHTYNRGFDIYMSQDGAKTWAWASGSYHHNAKAKLSQTPNVPLWPESVNKTGWRFEFTSGYVGLVRVGEASAMVLYDYAIPYSDPASGIPTESSSFSRDFNVSATIVGRNVPFSYAMRIDFVPKFELESLLV